MKPKMKKQMRITLDCPNCGCCELMDIKEKGKIKILHEQKVIFNVHCPKCGYDFVQIGRRSNFWRDVEKRYKLSHGELRKAQKQFMKDFLEGKIP